MALYKEAIVYGTFTFNITIVILILMSNKS